MSALLRSELLKVRTTRTRFAYPLAVILLTGLGVAGMVGSAPDADRGTVRYQTDLVDPATLAGLLALILGITVVTADFRHGTITPTLLATPVRERVVVAKTVVSAALGAMLGVFAIAVVAAVAVPWLLALGHDVHAADGGVLLRALQVVAAAALWGALGAVLGAVVHSQIAAIVGAVVWLLIAEHLIAALLGLTDLAGVAEYFPGRVVDSLAGNDDDALRAWEALVVALAYIGALGALGLARTRRRDIA